MPNKRINVTQAFLPPLAEYEAYVQKIWDTDWLTNQGPLLQELESELSSYLSVDNFHLVSNGTLALQLALQSLDITEGEIITTPFSYVATTSAILWQRCTPVFVDIEPDTFCIDADKIEAAITPSTKAILAVHVFGYPCDIEKIEAIAQKHNLKVIYDGAHAFGVTYRGASLLSYGDISICSFHATKLFHTIEGGAVIARDKAVSDKVELVKRFGHNGDEHYLLGINAKTSEFNAAMGLCNLKYLREIMDQRKAIIAQYAEQLGSKIHQPQAADGYTPNYAYCPLLLDSEPQLLAVIAALNADNVFPRRYFYPSLNTLPYLSTSQSCPEAEDIAKRILCLPLYVGLEAADVDRICAIIKQASTV